MGWFSISREALMRDDRETLRAIFRDLIILQTEYRFDVNGTTYLAEGDQFDEVPEGEEAPTYDLVIDGRQVEFVRRETTNGSV